MKNTKYIVWFSNDNYDPQSVKVMAFNASQAIILAQARRINKGLDYTVCKIETKEVADGKCKG